MLSSLVVFVFVFSLVILVHELGHYLAARRFGIKVLEFGVGYPPRIRTLAVRDGVEYTLNALPIGGFVRMLGEEDPSDPASFAAKGAWVRVRTLLAGSGMNLLLAVVLFIAAFMLGEQKISGQVLVDSVVPNSPAEQAGIQPGDLVIAVGAQTVSDTWELVTGLRDAAGREVSVTLLRDGVEQAVRVVPRLKPPAGEGAVGIAVRMAEGFEIITVHHPPGEAIALGMQEAWNVLGETVSGFARMLRVGFSPGEIAGPVGILQIGGVVAQTGLVNLMHFVGLLSLNLLVINLLPLPPLDGGRIAFVLLEKLRGGRRFAPQHEGMVHFVGMLVLLGFTVVVSYFDIVRIFGGGTAVP